MLMLLCFNIAYYRSNRQVSYAIKKCLVGAFTYTLGNFEKPCHINQKDFLNWNKDFNFSIPGLCLLDRHTCCNIHI